jgi:trans-aconitate methyltransferase
VVTLPSEYFEDIYAQHHDPWGFRSRWYEARKRALTLAALTEDRYGSVFEPGCSIGILTAALAARSDEMLAMDISSRALEQAARDLPADVRLQRGSVPDDWPDRHFDLIVLSEVGYYLDHLDCRLLARLAVGSADELVAVHWRHPVADYPLTGDEVHDHIRDSAEDAGLKCVVAHREADLRLDVWSRDHRSVAARNGLVTPCLSEIEPSD